MKGNKILALVAIISILLNIILGVQLVIDRRRISERSTIETEESLEELIALSENIVESTMQEAPYYYEPWFDVLYNFLTKQGVVIDDMDINMEHKELIIVFQEPGEFDTELITETQGKILGAAANLVDKSPLKESVENLVLLCEAGQDHAGALVCKVADVIALANKQISNEEFLSRVRLAEMPKEIPQQEPAG